MKIQDLSKKELKIKDIFSKKVMNKELEYITQYYTLNNAKIFLNAFNITFNSYEYFKISKLIIIYMCLSDFNLKYPEDEKIKRD